MIMKMNKNIIIGALILFLACLGYYSFYNKEKKGLLKNATQITAKDEVEDYFVQNKDCLRYKGEIAKKLETKESSFGEASLEQIFYSPKINSCVYVEYTEKNGFYGRRLFDIRNDGYSSHPLTSCMAVSPLSSVRDTYEKLDGNLTRYYEDLSNCNNFEDKLAEYK